MELVELAKANNSMAFGCIVERYGQRITATITGMLGHVAEVEDVAQTVFLSFYKSLDQYKGEAQLSTYLTRIAINLSLNALKVRKRQSWFTYFSMTAGLKEASDSDEHQAPPLQIADETDYGNQALNRDLVQKALNKLPDDLRTVAVLRLMEGYSTQETANLLQIPLGTVLSKLARARDKLRLILQHLGYEQ